MPEKASWATVRVSFTSKLEKSKTKLRRKMSLTRPDDDAADTDCVEDCVGFGSLVDPAHARHVATEQGRGT